MANLTIKAGQNPLIYTGTTPLSLSAQSWYTTVNVKTVFIPTTNNQGFQSGTPGNSFGVTSLPVAASGRRSGVVLVAKIDFTVSTNLFGPLAKPTISSVAPTSVASGSLVNVTGTDFDTVAYVLIGGVSCAITQSSVTSTNVTVTLPVSVAAGSNVPVIVVTAGGYSNVVSTLTVTGGTTQKLAKPVINTPVSVTSTTATFTWPLVAGADGYMFRLNSGTVYPLGNVGTYQVTNLNPSTAVTGEVYATDSTGAKTSSDYSLLVSATTLATNPNVPLINGFSPASAKAGSNATIIVTGQNLGGVTSASFNGTAAVFVQSNSMAVSLMLPAGATTGKIQLVCANGTVTSTTDFTVVPAGTNRTVMFSTLPGAVNNSNATWGAEVFGTDNTAVMQAALNSGNYDEIICDMDVLFTKLKQPTDTVISAIDHPSEPYSTLDNKPRKYGLLLQTAQSGVAIRNSNPQAMGGNGLPLPTQDKDLGLRNIYVNANGFELSTGNQRQEHDTAPDAQHEGGWSVFMSRVGVLRPITDNVQFVNNRTMFVHDKNVVDPLLRSCTYYSYRKSDGSQVINTDGHKHTVVSGLNLNTIKGACGDDLFSIMATEAGFNQYPSPNNANAPTYYDPYPVWGFCTNNKVDVVDFDNTGVGMRFGSSAANTKVKDLYIGHVTGTVQQTGAIFDNYTENPLSFNSGPGVQPGPGYFGLIKIPLWDAEMVGNGAKQCNLFLNGVFDGIDIGKVMRRNYHSTAGAFGRAWPGAQVEYIHINSVDTAQDYRNDAPLIFVEGYLKELVIDIALMDNRQNNQLSGGNADKSNTPLLKMGANGRVDKVTIKNVEAYLNIWLIDNTVGSIGEIVLDTVKNENGKGFDQDAVYVGQGCTIDKITANNFTALSGVVGGPGTVTTKVGNAF